MDQKFRVVSNKILRLLSIACILFGGYELLGLLAANILAYISPAPGISVGQAATIGIIGGADGPTAIFVTTPLWTACILPVLLLTVGIIGLCKLKKT